MVTTTNPEVLDLSLPDATDVTAVKAFVKKSQTDYKKYEGAKPNVTTRAAYATWYGEHVFHNLYQSSQKDNAYTNEQWALTFGVNSKGAPTGWRTMGRVLFDLDLNTGEFENQPHNHPVFIRLRSTNGYTNPDVKKAIDASDATAASIMAAMDKREADKKGRGGRPNDGTTTTPLAPGEALDKDGNIIPVEVRLMAAVEMVDALTKDISTDFWAEKVQPRLTKVIERENLNRSKAAATPAKKATPRKRAAKKAAAAA